MPPRRPLNLDRIDRKLLDLIQQDAAVPLHALGDAVGLSPSAVQRRLGRFRSAGLIASQIAVLDPAAVDGTIRACVLVALEHESKKLHEDFQHRMRAAAEVQQCYDLAGEWDYLVIVATNGMPRCRELLNELFLAAANIKRYETLFVFDAIKLGLNIPMQLPRGQRE